MRTVKAFFFGIAVALGGLMVAGQTIIDVHPGKVEVASTASDALKVLGDAQIATSSSNPAAKIGTLTINDTGSPTGSYNGALFMSNISAFSGSGDTYGTQGNASFSSWGIDLGGRRGGDGGTFSSPDSFTIGRRPAGGSWSPFLRIASDGSIQTSGTFIAGGAVGASGIISPSMGGTSQNNWAPTGHASAYFWRITTGGGSPNITGIAGGFNGRHILLKAQNGNVFVLQHLSGSSTATNQISTPEGTAYTVGGASAPELIELVYDGADGLWFVIGK